MPRGAAGAVPSNPSVRARVSSQIAGNSESSLALLAQIEVIAPRSATVLVEGETGVGKEIAAREIHALSRRAGRPFVPVDCTAFSSELMG